MSQSHESQSTLYNFTCEDSLLPWSMPAKDWLIEHHKDNDWDGLATASVIFNLNGDILLIQRAAHDSMPNKWEFPGGACDDEDPSILHAAARELFEEAGLVATHFAGLVTDGPDGEHGQVFPNRNRTKTWCRFTFHVEVKRCDSVTLDPNEHQDFVWASEEEFGERRMRDGRELAITHDAVVALILEAFRSRKNQSEVLQGLERD